MNTTTNESCCPQGGQDFYSSLRKFLSAWMIGTFVLLLGTAGTSNGQCVSNADCDDGNLCTTDKCRQGFCQHKPFPKLEFEYDGHLCVGDSVHIKNESEGVDPAATYYLDWQSDGSIDFSIGASLLPEDSTLSVPFSGSFSFTVIVVNPNGCSDTLDASVNILDCDDGDLCTRDECEDDGCEHEPLCDDDDDGCAVVECVAGVCTSTPVNCDDGDPCTRDKCDDGGCAHEPLCHDDDDGCAVVECVNGVCISTPVNCDDGDLCTRDKCDDGGCEHEPFCHDDDDDDGCAVVECIAGVCISTHTVCDDGDLCTRDECDDGECKHRPVKCNDDNACTIDACDAGTGDCIHTVIVCDDSDPCTKDRCTGLGCRFTTIKCDDDNDCTLDECVGGICSHTSIITCDDGDLCTRDECDDGGCKHEPFCNDDDDDGCAVVECVAGVCISTPTICDDGDLCTHDECDDGECEHRPVKCRDENACTMDACDNGVCSHTPVVCNDNDPCTADRCTEDGCKFRRIRGCVAKQSGSDNEFAIDDVTYTENGVSLNAYPNPFADKLSIEFSLSQDSKVVLEIYNIAGQKLATIFEGEVKASDLKKVEYSPESPLGGMIIYRLKTTQGSFYNKAMMLK